MKEIWKDIKGFEGRYKVSNLGRVKSLPRQHYCGHNSEQLVVFKERIMKTREEGRYCKYKRLTLLDKDGNKVNKSVHRLVAETFIPNPDNLPEINHKDRDTFNNCVDNLEWCTHEYNLNYDGRKERCIESSRKATQKAVECITTKKKFNSVMDAAKYYNISDTHICAVCSGKRNYCGKLSDGTKLVWKYI